MARHRPGSLVANSVAGAVVVVATFLPWLHSGTTSRSSYELLGVVARLDIAPDGTVSSLIRWWPVVPLLVTLAVVLAWWSRWRTSLAAAVVAVAYAGGVGGAVSVGSRGTDIGVGAGPWVCAGASVVFLATSAWMAFSHSTTSAARAPIAAPPVDRS